MKTILPASFFVGNRHTLRQQTEAFPIVITAHGALQRTGDGTLPFVQDSNFWYLTGLDTPDVVLVIEKQAEYLIVPGRSDIRSAFDGAIDETALTERSGVQTIMHEREGYERLRSAMEKSGHVSSLLALPIYTARQGLYAHPARRRLLEKLRRLHPKVTVEDIRPLLRDLRSLKQAVEINCIREAVDITKQALAAVETSLQQHQYTHEYQLEAALSCAFRMTGSTGHAYLPIVAEGKNATTLHYIENNAPLQKGSLIVVDVGAEVEHYAADITRTFQYGQVSDRQKQVYEAVELIQKQVISHMKPGARLSDIERKTERLIGAALYDLGLITDKKNRADIRRYYPHSVSHFLGLDVHDVGDYNAPLKAGMVLTCEPGIYIPEEGIGVRIEDDVLITKTDNEIL